MMGRLCSGICLPNPSGGALASERKLDGGEIRAILAGKSLAGESEGGAWRQSFSVSGDTEHSTGQGHSSGMWDVRGNQYCSRWPPGDHWTCYDVLRDGEDITFVSPAGERTRTARRLGGTTRPRYGAGSIWRPCTRNGPQGPR